MSRLKELKEKRASVFAEIDALRKDTDSRAMTAEEQSRWDALMAEYGRADKAVEAEERYLDVQKRQVEGEERRLRETKDEKAGQSVTSEKEVLELINGGDIMFLAKTAYDSVPDPAGGETQTYKSLGQFTTATTNSCLDYLYIFSSTTGWQYLALNG